MDIRVDAYIPESYIMDSKQKIDMYKRFRAVESFEDITDLQYELIDRFGKYPEEVDHLFSVTKVKLLARDEGIETISEKNNQCKLVLGEEATSHIDGSKLFTLVNKLSSKLHLSMEGSQIAVHLKTKSLSDGEYLSVLQEVLSKLPDAQKDKAANI